MSGNVSLLCLRARCLLMVPFHQGVMAHCCQVGSLEEGNDVGSRRNWMLSKPPVVHHANTGCYQDLLL